MSILILGEENLTHASPVCQSALPCRFPTKVQESGSYFLAVLTRNFCSYWSLSFVTFSPNNRNWDHYNKYELFASPFTHNSIVNYTTTPKERWIKKSFYQLFVTFIYILYDLQLVYKSSLNLASHLACTSPSLEPPSQSS